jgi:hypothetical protein
MAQPEVRNFNSTVRAKAFIVRGVKAIAASATFTKQTNGGRTNVLGKADGLTVTLPAAVGSGTIFRILVGTTLTSNTYVIQVANATDVFRGGVIINDIGDSSAATADFFPTASTSDTITLTASIGAGKAGDFIEIEDYAAGFFAVRGVLQGETDPTNPFSAAV